MSKKLAVAFSAFILSSGMAFAQAAEGPWTMDEFMAAYPEVTPELFVQIDTNGDGMIDQEELDAAVEAGLVEESDEG